MKVKANRNFVGQKGESPRGSSMVPKNHIFEVSKERGQTLIGINLVTEWKGDYKNMIKKKVNTAKGANTTSQARLDLFELAKPLAEASKRKLPKISSMSVKQLEDWIEDTKEIIQKKNTKETETPKDEKKEKKEKEGEK